MTAGRKVKISLESVLLGRLSDITCPDSLLETVGRKDRLLLAHGFNEFDGLLLTYARAFCSS